MRPPTSVEQCQVCGQPLLYLQIGQPAECIRCGRKETANIICPDGHYVCDQCHGEAVTKLLTEQIEGSLSTDSIAIATQLFNQPTLPMLGCEHALIACGALLVALRNSGKVAVSAAQLQEAWQRTSRQAIGGYCGLTGICGITVGIGAAFSALLQAACPKDVETRLTMEIVGRVVQAIAELTGPCCCKAFVLAALNVAVAACKEIWDVELPSGTTPVCEHVDKHPHGCRQERCPYFAG